MKLEPKGTLSLDQGAEEQAMVIIERGMTMHAQSNADDKERAVLTKQDAAIKKKAKAEAIEQRERAKAQAARMKSEDAALEKKIKEKIKKAERKAEIKHLKEQVGMLRLNQQPTLADKPSDLAQARKREKEKKKEEERRKKRSEEEKKVEKEERSVNWMRVANVLAPDANLKDKQSKSWPTTPYSKSGPTTPHSKSGPVTPHSKSGPVTPHSRSGPATPRPEVKIDKGKQRETSDAGDRKTAVSWAAETFEYSPGSVHSRVVPNSNPAGALVNNLTERFRFSPLTTH